MKLGKRIFVVVVIISLCAAAINIFKTDQWDHNAELLKEQVLAIGEQVETINLAQLTPFEWDEVYSFDPYTSKEAIYETVGYQWDRISETVSEGMNQIVFLNNGEVVCYVYGYPENNGYGISLGGKSRPDLQSASVRSAADDLTFQVVRSNHTVYLRK